MLQDYSILYVEDDFLSREGLEMVLRRVMGIRNVWVFEDSTDIMARLKGLPQAPDMILLDIHMKPHSGFEVLAMLRADPDYLLIPVLALTASVMNEEVEMLRSSGFDGAIGKPINIDTFPALLEKAARGETIWAIA